MATVPELALGLAHPDLTGPNELESAVLVGVQRLSSAARNARIARGTFHLRGHVPVNAAFTANHHLQKPRVRGPQSY